MFRNFVKNKYMKVIDIAGWNRKEHFEFFSKMASPYFGFTTEVDCTQAYKKAKDNSHSFFAAYLHASMIAVNAVDELKMRILDDNIVLYDTVNAGTTIGRADGTFGLLTSIFLKISVRLMLSFRKKLTACKTP